MQFKDLSRSQRQLIQQFEADIVPMLESIQREEGIKGRVKAESMLMQHLGHHASRHYTGEDFQAFVATLTIVLFGLANKLEQESPQYS